MTTQSAIAPFEAQLSHVKRVQWICGVMVLAVGAGMPFIPVDGRNAAERESMMLSLLVVGGLLALAGAYLMWRGLRALAAEPAIVLLTKTPERIVSFYALRHRMNGIHTKTTIVFGIEGGRSVKCPIPIAAEAHAISHVRSIAPRARAGV